MSKTRRLATLAVTVSVAMILSYLESLIPTFVPIPGIKLGLANIAVIFILYKLGPLEAAAVSAVRVGLSSLLFGSVMSLAYSLAGAALSLAVMLILKLLTPLNTIAVSVMGGVFHNVGQIIVASIILETNILIYYLPFLALSGTVAGIAVGVASGALIKKVKI